MQLVVVRAVEAIGYGVATARQAIAAILASAAVQRPDQKQARAGLPELSAWPDRGGGARRSAGERGPTAPDGPLQPPPARAIDQSMSGKMLVVSAPLTSLGDNPLGLAQEVGCGMDADRGHDDDSCGERGVEVACVSEAASVLAPATIDRVSVALLAVSQAVSHCPRCGGSAICR